MKPHATVLPVDPPTLPPVHTVVHAATAPRAVAGFELLDELGRGGMGVVYRARDVELDREVAVKVLGASVSPHSGGALRFADEVRITGQLQHPGIPPVYRVGQWPDGRPFMALKLIKGTTLADLISSDGVANRLGVFEAISQAVGYAHAHGVIHRDLKPANVMVGRFGEVQVMDWGLAKVLSPLSRQENAGEGNSGTTVPPTAIRSLRESETEHGRVMGTAAYMAPEQAIGAVNQLDRRTDVFGLGGILAAMLTGKPPFVGTDYESTRQLAARAKLADCFARLDASGAEPELVALCKRCLSAESDDRPADGTAVAEAVAALRAAADERARRAEVDRERAEVRAAEQRTRRRVVAWSAAVVGVVLLAGLAMVVVLAVWATQAEQQATRQLEQNTKASRATAELLEETEKARRMVAAQLKDAEEELTETDQKLSQSEKELRATSRKLDKLAEVQMSLERSSDQLRSLQRQLEIVTKEMQGARMTAMGTEVKMSQLEAERGHLLKELIQANEIVRRYEKKIAELSKAQPREVAPPPREAK